MPNLGEVEFNHIPDIPDEGCEFLPKCLTCPLVDCFLMRERPSISRQRLFNDLVEETWATGARPPELLDSYTGLNFPDDIRAALGIPQPFGTDYIEEAEVEAIAALRDKGMTSGQIGKLLNRQSSSIRMALRRSFVRELVA